MSVKKFTKTLALFLASAVLLTGLPDTGAAGVRSAEAAERELADVNEASENKKDTADSAKDGKEKKTAKSKKKLRKKKSKKARKHKRNKKKDKKKNKKKNKKRNKKKIKKQTEVVVGPYIDGVYQGSARGYTDQIKVEVTVKDGNIVKVDVIEQKEDALYWAAAKKVADRIVKSGKTQVDVSAGATISSKAIMYAVEDALKNAVRKKDEKKEEKKVETGWKDGYYKGTSGGYSGVVTSGVKIADSKIESVEVLSHTDDHAYMEVAKNLIKDILKKQTPEVDVVSGATYSSNGIINSTKDALEQAYGRTKAPGESEYAKKNMEDHSEDTGGAAGKKEEIDFGTLTDGVYTGSASGYRSNSIEVRVTVQGGKITKIELIRNGDDKEYFNDEKAKKLEKDIIAKQSSKVDTIAGATKSSVGFINSVVNALKNAGYLKKVTDNFDGKGKSVGALEVTGKKVTVKNVTVNDTLLIGKEVGEGEVSLENVTAKGEIRIEGGGENSIHFKNCMLQGRIVVKKDGAGRVRASFERGTEVKGEVTLSSAAIIETEEGVKLPTLKIGTNVKGDSRIEVEATVENLDIKSDTAKILIKKNSKIEHIEFPETVENFTPGKKDYQRKDGKQGFHLQIEENAQIRNGSNRNKKTLLSFLTKEEVKELDKSWKQAEGVFGGDATGFISTKPVPVEVEIRGGRIQEIRKLEDEIEKIAGNTVYPRDIDDGAHYSWALKALSDRIKKNQNPLEVDYKFRMMMQIIETVMKETETKPKSIATFKEALERVTGKSNYNALNRLTDSGAAGLNSEHLTYLFMDCAKEFLYDELEYDKSDIDAVARATFSGKGSALAIGNAVKKTRKEVTVTDLKIDHRYKLDYTENDKLDFTGLTAEVKFKDKDTAVRLPYSEFEKNGLKVVTLRGNKEIKEGIVLNEENLGSSLSSGLSLKVVHENSDSVKFLKIIHIKPKTLLLRADGIKIRAKGTDTWIELKGFDSSLGKNAGGTYIRLDQHLIIKPEDHAKLAGKEIEFKLLTTVLESGEKRELTAKGNRNDPLIGADTPRGGYTVSIDGEEFYDKVKKVKYRLDDLYSRNYRLHIKKESQASRFNGKTRPVRIKLNAILDMRAVRSAFRDLTNVEEITPKMDLQTINTSIEKEIALDLVLKFKDGSSKEVTVRLLITNKEADEAEKFEPKTRSITVARNAALTEEIAKKAFYNLPNGTSLKLQGNVAELTKEVGVKMLSLQIVFSDHSTYDMQIEIKVQEAMTKAELFVRDHNKEEVLKILPTKEILKGDQGVYLPLLEKLMALDQFDKMVEKSLSLEEKRKEFGEIALEVVEAPNRSELGTTAAKVKLRFVEDNSTVDLVIPVRVTPFPVKHFEYKEGLHDYYVIGDSLSFENVKLSVAIPDKRNEKGEWEESVQKFELPYSAFEAFGFRFINLTNGYEVLNNDKVTGRMIREGEVRLGLRCLGALDGKHDQQFEIGGITTQEIAATYEEMFKDVKEMKIFYNRDQISDITEDLDELYEVGGFTEFHIREHLKTGEKETLFGDIGISINKEPEDIDGQEPFGEINLLFEDDSELTVKIPVKFIGFPVTDVLNMNTDNMKKTEFEIGDTIDFTELLVEVEIVKSKHKEGKKKGEWDFSEKTTVTVPFKYFKMFGLKIVKENTEEEFTEDSVVTDDIIEGEEIKLEVYSDSELITDDKIADNRKGIENLTVKK